MNKRWKDISWAECPACGDSVQAHSDADAELVYDGDDARCDECDWHGCFYVDEPDEEGNHLAGVQDGNLDGLCEVHNKISCGPCTHPELERALREDQVARIASIFGREGAEVPDFSEDDIDTGIMMCDIYDQCLQPDMTLDQRETVKDLVLVSMLQPLSVEEIVKMAYAGWE